MTSQVRQLGPVTVGALIGAGVGALDTLPAMDAIRRGAAESHEFTVLLLPFGFAVLGGGLGFFAELLLQRAAFSENRWARHVVRPLMFCTLPYLALAFSFWCFGNDRLFGGFGFWFCVVILPLLGLQIAWRRSRDPVFDRTFT